jgi:hypothetical protein
MKTLKQLLEDLQPHPVATVPTTDPIREQYFQGKIFNIGDIVESAGILYKIVYRGTNHLVLENEAGDTVRKFPQELSIVQVNEDQYGADYVYSQTKNKDGSRRKNHIKRIEFANSGMITKSKRIVKDTHRVGKPLTLKPDPVSNPYKNLIKNDDDRRSLKSFVRKLDKTVHPIPPKHHKRVNSGETTGGAPEKKE